MAIRIVEHPVFTRWLNRLRDRRGLQVIQDRLYQWAERGNPGDVKYFKGIGEMRIHVGPGYRVYFVRREDVVVVLLCGGDKDSQTDDVVRALKLAREVRDDEKG